MALGSLSDKPKADNHEPAAEPASHVTGKPTELEPREIASTPQEAPEAADAPLEAPDAGYGRRTDSSNWEQRGRN